MKRMRRDNQSSMRWCGNDDGFTLIEIVVALAILGGGLFILLESHLGALRLFDEAQEEATITMLLQSAVGDAERAVLAGEASGDGDFGLRLSEYSYRFSMVPVDQEELPGLLEVTLTLVTPVEEREVQFRIYQGDQTARDDAT